MGVTLRVRLYTAIFFRTLREPQSSKKGFSFQSLTRTRFHVYIEIFQKKHNYRTKQKKLNRTKNCVKDCSGNPFAR